MGEKIFPSWRCMVKIGRWATMMMMIENTVGRPISITASWMVRVCGR